MQDVLSRNRLKLLAPESGVMLGAGVAAAQTPGAVALLARIGLGFVELDGAAMKPAAASALCLLARALDLPALVRVSDPHRANFGPALEGGACGLSIGGVADAAAARQVVRDTRFAPLGMRGTFEPGPHNDYLDDPQDLAALNRELHITVRLDPAISSKALREIAALDGIDAIELEGVTARDLAGPLQASAAAVREAGAVVSALARSSDEIAFLAAAGVQMIRLSDDVDVLAAYFTQALRDLHVSTRGVSVRGVA